jgi:hypothetical protein
MPDATYSIDASCRIDNPPLADIAGVLVKAYLGGGPFTTDTFVAHLPVPHEAVHCIEKASRSTDPAVRSTAAAIYARGKALDDATGNGFLIVVESRAHTILGIRIPGPRKVTIEVLPR